MIFKKIDFISPEITLFYKGSLSHSSIISGVISFISCAIIICISFYCFLGIFDRERDCPKIANNNQYIEDAGIFPLNSSYLFHFISYVEDGNEPNYEFFDFTSFNLIGFENYGQNMESGNDITKYNHWLYGLCSKENDIKGIENLVTQHFFANSACIRKYFDSSTQNYYEIGDKNFRWPTLEHGTFNPKNKIYSLIVYKCDQNILNNIFGKGHKCKNNEEIEKVINKRGLIHFNFIDHYVDILKFEEPIKKYFYRIENTIDIDNYSINNINFNPILIKTQKGAIFDKYEYKTSYSYERNDVFIKLAKGNIYMQYSLWLNNRVNFYERIYKKLSESLTTMGGTANSIILIASFINKIINQFTVLKDIQSILNSSHVSIDEINQPKKRIELKKISNINPKNIENNSIIKNVDKTDISSRTNLEIFDKNSVISKEDKKEKQINNVENNNKENKNGTNINKSNESNNHEEKIKFWKFLVHKFSCGKKNHDLQLYEDFREKIISVENLIQINLNTHNILKLKDKINEV